MLPFGDEEVLLAAPPLLPALGRAVLPFVAAWPAAEPPHQRPRPPPQMQRRLSHQRAEAPLAKVEEEVDVLEDHEHRACITALAMEKQHMDLAN